MVAEDIDVEESMLSSQCSIEGCEVEDELRKSEDPESEGRRGCVRAAEVGFPVPGTDSSGRSK